MTLSLNTIYFTSITEKAHITYRRILEGAGVGIMWSYVMVETEVPGGNHRPSTGDHYPATRRRQESNPGPEGDKKGFYSCATSALIS